MTGSMGKGLLLLVAAGLFLVVNIAANSVLTGARLDLTENGLYTLSDGTRRILTGLPDPIHLRLYLSPALAAGTAGMAPHVARVRDMLREYARVADDRLVLEIISTPPYSKGEDLAMGDGLRAIAAPGSRTSLFFGLVAQGPGERREVMPFLVPAWEPSLEYDLTVMIQRVAHPDKKRVGLLSTLPLTGVKASVLPGGRKEEPPWAIATALEKQYEIKSLETTAEQIPPDLDLLLVVHPQEFKDSTLHAIEQFAFAGKPVVILADPFCQAQGNATPYLAVSNPEKLFHGWGFEMVAERVAGDLKAAKRIRFNSVHTGSQLVNHPAWMDLGQEHFSHEDPATRQLDLVTLISAGILQPRAAGQVPAARLIPLITTGPQGGRYDIGALGPSSTPDRLIRDFKPEGTLVLAARIAGPLPSAFPDGAPVGAMNLFKADRKEGHIPQSPADLKLVVVADCDFLQDQFWVRTVTVLDLPVAVPYAGNARLLLNLLDHLTGNDDLIGPRSQVRSGAARPFVTFQLMREQSELRFQEKRQQLNQRLVETQQRFLKLQQERPEADKSDTLTPEQKAEIETFRMDILMIREQLREVQRQLNQDVANLQAWLKFLGMGLMPLLLGVGGLLLGGYRVRRNRGTAARLAE
ncbi:MAG: Gldg family protein [Magnetococcales bacterium]|nr:Gldg family protein [Magnetococcales bacterium]